MTEKSSVDLRTDTTQLLDEVIHRMPELADDRESILAVTAAVCACYKAGGTVFTCGNGGSAADSEHIVGELMKGFILERTMPQGDIDQLKSAGIEGWEHLAETLQQGIPAISLVGHSSLSTAVVNDSDPYMTFAQQLYVLGKPGDVVIGLSTSGNSVNVLNALKVARTFGITTVGMTGSRPAKMDELCDIIVKLPSTITHRIQEYHMAVYHAICFMAEHEIFAG